MLHVRSTSATEAKRVWGSAGLQGRGEMGALRGNPPTSGIIRQGPHTRKSRSYPRRESNPVHLGYQTLIGERHSNMLLAIAAILLASV
ncbi:hypothetical protein PR048_029686 [Dryococelus australis]|uniref:Uncharacterized protein n=1 Tax=Dryococelus australis TaxID=614101 RepID=A0ABQ9GED6_9NEOP|nr:hypothetical protein PR048_029686 [Dryococelus australis]